MDFKIGDLVSFKNNIFIVVNRKLVLYKKSQRIINFIDAQNIVSGRVSSFPSYWLNKIENNLVDKTMPKPQKKIIDKTMELGNGQKMTVGKLVEHKTVPKLGLGLVVAESRNHPNYWIVKWCDPRYHDVGQMGIHAEYLKIM